MVKRDDEGHILVGAVDAVETPPVPPENESLAAYVVTLEVENNRLRALLNTPVTPNTEPLVTDEQKALSVDREAPHG